MLHREVPRGRLPARSGPQRLKAVSNSLIIEGYLMSALFGLHGIPMRRAVPRGFAWKNRTNS
jgi:hypothetical protein